MTVARFTEAALDVALDVRGITPVVAAPGLSNVVPFVKPSPLSGGLPAHFARWTGADMNAAMRAGLKPASFELLPNVDQAAMVKALLAYPPIAALADAEYDKGWLEIVWAVAHAAYLGVPGVRDHALAWSKTSLRFTDAGFDKAWNDYKPHRPKPITVATLIGRARDTGFDLSPWFEDDRAAAPLPSIPPGGQDPFDATADWGNDDLTDFLYGMILAAGYLTLLGAGGGTGKSALATAIAVCCATGRDLLGEHVAGRLPVLMLNLEDGRSKVRRGVKAVCQQYGINPADLNGYLFTAGVDDVAQFVPGGLRLVTVDRQTRRETINEVALAWLRDEMVRRQIRVLILDPFSRLIRGNENAVDVVDQLMECLTVMAGETGCAILIAQHLCKNGGGLQQDGAAAFRGSGAIVDAARNAYGARRLSAIEAANIGAVGSETLIVLTHEKGNLSRLQEPTYYQIVPVRLPGGNPQTDPPHMEAGRWAHTVERFTPRSAAQAITDPMRNAVMVALDRGMKDALGAAIPFGPPPSKPGGKVSNDPIPACAAALQGVVPGLDPARAGALAMHVVTDLIAKAHVTQQAITVQKYAKKDDGSFKSNGKADRQGLIVHWQSVPWRATTGVTAGGAETSPPGSGGG